MDWNRLVVIFTLATSAVLILCVYLLSNPWLQERWDIFLLIEDTIKSAGQSVVSLVMTAFMVSILLLVVIGVFYILDTLREMGHDMNNLKEWVYTPVTEREDRINRLTQQVESLQQENNEVSALNESLRDTKEHLAAETQRMEEERDRMQNDFEERRRVLENEIDEKCEQRKVMEEDIDVKRVRMESLHKEIEQRMQEKTLAEAELQRQMEEGNSLQSEIANLRHQVTKENDHKQRLQSEIKGLEQRVGDIRLEMNEIVEEKNKLENDKRIAEEEKNSLEREMKRMEEERSNLQGEVNRIEEGKSKLETEMRGLGETKNYLQGEINRMREERQKYEEENERMREQKNTLVQQKSKLEEDRERLTQSKAVLKDAVKREKDKKKRIEDDIMRKGDEIGKLEEDKRKLMEDITRKREELETLHQQQATEQAERNVDLMVEMRQMDDMLTREYMMEVLQALRRRRNRPEVRVFDEEILAAVEPVFVTYVIPLNILYMIHHHNVNILMSEDIEVVRTVSRTVSKFEGAAELLSRLSRYPGWYDCILRVLRDPLIKMGHVADMMVDAVARAQRMRQEEEERQAAARREEGHGAEGGATAAGGQQVDPRESDENTLREQLRDLCRRRRDLMLPEWNDIQENVRRANVDHRTYDEEILRKIGPLFVMSVIPQNFLPLVHGHDRNVLVQQDIEAVTTTTANEGKYGGAAELLSRLSRYRGWFQCTLNVLRDRRVNQRHLADAMEALVRGHEGNMARAQHEHDGAVSSDGAGAVRNDFVEMTEERVRQLEKAYESQGDHEMEFSFWKPGDLQAKKADCQKCPGHEAFIPIKDFDLHHLPENHRSEEIKKFVRTFADLCVLIAVRYSSSNRPLGYPLCELAGEEFLYKFGNGWVTNLKDKFLDNQGYTCPCKACKSDPSKARKEWGEVRVSTAKHLVFDHHECELTQCVCFYDTDDSLSTLPRLLGVDIVDSDLTSDRCEITCVTHDIEVFQKLNRVYSHYTKLCRDIDLKSKQECSVVISHIHGLSKVVSVGDRTQIKGTKYLYNAPTCLGSSGAPICVLGQATQWEKYDIIPKAHRKCIGEGFKESSGS